jgi:hypothetical protein
LGLFDIRSQNDYAKGLQRFDFEEVILPHKEHKISINPQHNENLECLVLTLRRVFPSAMACFAKKVMRSAKLSAVTVPICPSQHQATRGKTQT